MPNDYYDIKEMPYPSIADLSKPYRWSQKTIALILKNEVYFGHIINLKTTTKSFKNKKKFSLPFPYQSTIPISENSLPAQYRTF